MKKKIVTIVLAASMLITSLYTSAETANAADLGQNIGAVSDSGESEAPIDETASSGENLPKEAESPTEEGTGEAAPPKDEAASSGENLPESPSESQTEESGLLPESASEENALLPESASEESQTLPESTSEETETPVEESLNEASPSNNTTTNKDDIETNLTDSAEPEEGILAGLFSAGRISSHSMSKIYWNPNKENTLSGTGNILQYAGNDDNSGSTARYPVLTAESVLERAAAEAEVVCMNYCGCTGDTVIDAGFYPVSIGREPEYTGNIFQITGGILELDNLTLDGSDSYADRVLTVGRGGTLKIGESVGNVGDSFYFVEAAANAIVLAGEPESSTKYNVQFAEGFFDKGRVTVEETRTEEVLLVDASVSGLRPSAYFSVKNLPAGWTLYQKNNQLWAKTPIIPTPQPPYKEIWVDGVGGDDFNSGRDSGSCVKTWERAYELCLEKLGGNGTICVAGTVTISDGVAEMDGVTIKRAEWFTGVLFTIESSGAMKIGKGVRFEKEEEETDDEDEDDDEENLIAINSAGALEIDKSAAIEELIALNNRAEPLTLTGSGAGTFHISAGGDYTEGDLIVKNGVNPVVSLEIGKYALKAVQEDSYLYIPPIVYIDGAAGDDSRDGRSTWNAVRTLKRAAELAMQYTTGTLVVSGGPIVISDADEVLDPNLLIQNNPGYHGDLFQVTDKTLKLYGKVYGNIAAEGTGKVYFNGEKSNGTITLSGNASFEMRGGTWQGAVTEEENAAIVHTNGKIQGSITMQGGTYLLQGGKVKGEISLFSGTPELRMEGGTIDGQASVRVGNFLMTGGTVKGTGVTLFASKASFSLSGGSLTGCSRAVEVSAGTFTMTGGSISAKTDASAKTNALVLEEKGTAFVSGGEILSGEIRVGGSLHLGGTPKIVPALVLSDTRYPVQLDGVIPSEYRYRLDFAGDYLTLSAVTVDAVVGSSAAPARLSQFSMDEEASIMLELSENGDNVQMTKGEDPVGIYWDGTNGEDGREGDSPGEAVKTFEKVKSLLLEKYADGEEYDVYVCGEVKLNRWSTDVVLEFKESEFPWKPKIIRYFGYNGCMFKSEGRSANLILRDIVIDGNGRTESDAMIDVGDLTYAEYGLVIEDGAVLQNSVGSVIECFRANLYLKGGIIRNNAGKQGNSYGLVDISQGKFYMSGGLIEKNQSSYAIIDCGFSSTTEITGGTIQENEGGNHFWGWGTCTITGGLFQNNKGNYGGVLCMTQSDMTITGGTFRNNTATEGGGAIYQGQEAHLEVLGGTFEGNEAPFGGAIYVSTDQDTSDVSLWQSLTISDCEMTGNVASENGDDIYFVQIGQTSYTTSKNVSIGNVQQNLKICLGRLRTNELVSLALSSTITNPTTKIMLEVDPAYAGFGDVVVRPDGKNVTDASQYIRNFVISPESGYTLVPSGKNIVLGQAYYVDGVNGDDSNTGNRPANAFRTIEKAIEELGSQAGSIYVCNTVTVAGGTVSWTLDATQNITRYTGGTDAFTGPMVEILDGATLELHGVSLYGALSEEDTEDNYILRQGGTLKMDGTSFCSNGILWLADSHVIEVSGTAGELLATVEKDNPKEADVIATYEAGGGDAADFRLSSAMAGFGLEADTDSVYLSTAGEIYVDGVAGYDGNSGLTVDKPVRTLAAAYTRLQGTGGTIYVLNTVSITADTVLTKWSCAVGATEVKTTGAVRILRYAVNQATLLKVSGSTLTLSGITVDGAGSAAAGNQSALVTVETSGILRLEGGAVLSSNQSSGIGGAVYNKGTTYIGNCTIKDNEAAKGDGIYHASGTAELTITDPKADVRDEIYLGTGAYLNVGVALSDGRTYALNLDSADAAEGRKIAVLARFAYGSGGALAEADHFAISKEATKRVLEEKDENTLVLAGDFEVTVSSTEIFAEAETEVVCNAVPRNAKASQMNVRITKNGKEIECQTKDYNRYKQIRIPVTEENAGTLKLTFTYGAASVEAELILSTYAVVYQDGAASLVARPQEAGSDGMHRDSAWIHVCNGANESRTFSVGEMIASYKDGSEVEIDNSKVSVDMADATRYLGIDMAPDTTLDAGEESYIPIELFNGNAIKEQKNGTITLADVTYGDSLTTMSLDFVTRPVSRVRVSLNLDDEPDYNAEVSAWNDKTGERTNLTLNRSGKQEQNFFTRIRSLFAAPDNSYYEAEGLAEGTYYIFVDGENTGVTFDLSKSAVVTSEIDRYHIFYETDGGTLADDAPELYIKGKGVAELPVPQKRGVGFAGWYDNRDCEGTPLSSIDAARSGRLTLYAAWETAQEFSVGLTQNSYLVKDGGAAAVCAEIAGTPVEQVAVSVIGGGAADAEDITEQCIIGASGNYKIITIPVWKERTGTYRLRFSYGGKQIEKDIVLSAYEITYANGQDALIAQAQEDGIDTIHTDTASVTIYNGYKEAKTFTVGEPELSYQNHTDEPKIANLFVEKNMEPASTMKYFGLQWDAQSREILGGGTETFTLTFSNGDRLTDNREGTLLLKGAALGEDCADIELSFCTKAITRLQMAGTYNDDAKEDLVLTLCRNGDEVCQLVNIIGEHPTAEQWYKAASGKLSLRYNYQITGLAAGTYDLFVNGKDCGRKITIVEGSVEKDSVSLYSITYNTNEGVLPQDAASYYIAGVRQELPIPERDGFEFGGWYLTESSEGNGMDAIEKDWKGALTLYAKWNVPTPVYAVSLEPTQTAPITSDPGHLIYDIAFVGGIAILMRMFSAERENGMDEEEKERLVREIIRRAKGRGMLLKIYALSKIFVILLFYHTLGVKERTTTAV